MGALAYELADRGTAGRQPRLFAVAGGAVAEPAPRPAREDDDAGALPVDGTPAPAKNRLGLASASPVRTLDAALNGLFAATTAGRQSACLLCGEAVRPAASGPARCGGCGSIYE